MHTYDMIQQSTLLMNLRSMGDLSSESQTMDRILLLNGSFLCGPVSKIAEISSSTLLVLSVFNPGPDISSPEEPQPLETVNGDC